jgi:hypothetical protein
MERRSFFKNAGIAGLCSCFVSRALAEDSASAAKKTKTKEDWRVEFAKQRFSKLVTLASGRLKEDEFRQLMQELGMFCSENGFAGNFPGQLEAYLQEMQKRWKAETSYDASAHLVQVTFHPTDADCSCPLMSKGLVPGAACQCSVGSMKRAFATVCGHPVSVELKESALQGGKNCSFAIHTQPA